MWPMKRVSRTAPAHTPGPPPGHVPARSPVRGSLVTATSRPLPHPFPTRPTALRGLREARDAIVLARLLRGNISARRATDVLALLEPHRPRLMPKPLNPLEGMVGQPQHRMLEALLRPIAPIVMDVLLPGLRDHLIDRLPGHPADPPESGTATPSTIDAAEAMRALVRLLRGGGRATLQAVVNMVELDARTDADGLIQTREPVTRGSIDALAGALLRFEVRRLLLEALGATESRQRVVLQGRRLARFALRHATEAIQDFVAVRDIRTLHASLATLASVDGLIVIALRNLDDQQESREERSAFVETADAKVLNDYLSAAWRLSDTLFRMVARAAEGGDLDDLLFAALLRQLRGLHHFCADLTHEERPPAMDRLEQRLVDRTRVLTRLAGERLVQLLLRRPADTEPARRLLHRARLLAQLLLDMGRADEVEEIALRLVIVRDTLEHRAA